MQDCLRFRRELLICSCIALEQVRASKLLSGIALGKYKEGGKKKGKWYAGGKGKGKGKAKKAKDARNPRLCYRNIKLYLCACNVYLMSLPFS